MPTAELVQSLESQSVSELWKQLNLIDPARAEKIDKNDHYRLVRALAIWHTQGQKPSEFIPVFEPLSPFHFITLTRDREQLYTMINQRVEIMMQSGWLAEVSQLAQDQQWHDFLLKKKMIGYDLLLNHLESDPHNQDLKKTVDLIAQFTRNYAKRQITFLNKLQINVQKSMQLHQKHESWPYRIEECNLTLYDLSLYIKQLSEFALGATTDAVEKKNS